MEQNLINLASYINFLDADTYKIYALKVYQVSTRNNKVKNIY